MNATRRLLLAGGAAIAIALAVIGLYAAGQESECVQTGRVDNPRGGFVADTCIAYSDPALAGTAPWWFFAAGAALVLTVVGLVSAAR